MSESNASEIGSVSGIVRGENPHTAIVQKFQRKEGDTGSPEVQVALLTERLETLAKHFTVHKEDKHSRVGMMKMISRRKSLLNYLRKENLDKYRETIAALGLRK